MITSVRQTERRQNATKDDEPRGGKRRRGQPRRGLQVLREFVENCGWEKMTRRTLANGFHLGHWVSVRRTDYKRGILSNDLIQQLEAIPGWTWDPVETRYREYLQLLRRFVEQHGMGRFNARTVYGGVRLGAWATCRRVDYRERRLAPWLKHELEQIPGWCWSVRDDFHERALQRTRKFVEEHGWGALRNRTVHEGIAIGAWATRRRADYRNGRLPQWLADELEKLPGWKWSVRDRHDRERAVA
jgi:hypothetical protein